MGCGNSSLEADLKAAEQGDAEAQFNLGLMYENGKGVRRDYAEAMKWYRKAAEEGFAAAQYMLGLVYEKGEGVPENDVAAYVWHSVAVASGVGSALKDRDRVSANSRRPRSTGAR